MQDPNNLLAWNFNTTLQNSVLIGTRFVARAKDKPGNITTREHVIV